MISSSAEASGSAASARASEAAEPVSDEEPPAAGAVKAPEERMGAGRGDGQRVVRS
jgi:hypothetical protein